jgi:hypothetical protein
MGREAHRIFRDPRKERSGGVRAQGDVAVGQDDRKTDHLAGTLGKDDEDRIKRSASVATAETVALSVAPVLACQESR